MRKRVSLFLVPALVLAACGGGDDDAAGASGDDWCTQALRIEASSERYDDAFDEGGTTLGEALDEFTSLLDDAKGSAPDEISDAVDTAADGIGRFNELLSDADYDVFALDESAFDELDAMGEEMDAATDQIDAYNARECGIPADSDDSDENADEAQAPDDEVAADEPAEEINDEAATDEGATFSGDPNSQWCVTNRELDELDDDFENLFLAEPEVVESKLTEMIGLYEAASSLAPPELAGDVAVSLASIKQLEAALIAADYDILNADLSVLEEDGAGQVASQNIEAYNEQVCGIPADGDDQTDSATDDGASDGGFDPAAGTIREQTVNELVRTGFTQAEAECIIDKIDFTDPDLGSDPSTMLIVFDECGIDLARLAELGG